MGNNNRFLATKSYIDFLNPGPGSSAATSLTFDTQPLGSAKSLKLNADDSISMFWSPTSTTHHQQQQQQEKKQQQIQHRQSLTEKPVTLFWGDTLGSESMVQTNDESSSSHLLKQHQLPTNTSTNLRNTVSSSNLALNINYNDSQQQQQQPPSSTNPTIPMVIPQKFQFNQPQSQPMMNKNSSSGSHDVMVSCEQQMLSSRKGSLPHSSSLLTNSSNNNNNNNSLVNQVVASSNNFVEINQSDSSNGKVSLNSTNGKHQQLTAASASSSSSTPGGSNSTSTVALLSSSAPTSASFVSENGSGEKSSSTKWPVVASPHQVMMLYMNKLTPFEHHEIYKYSQIYFIGANAKKRPGVGSNNSDYDNENGSYIHIPHDHIAYRYEVLKIIGKGSFGSVVKAYDHKTREHVALKMVRNEKRFHRQAQEEIRILKHLRNQDKENSFNIIHM
jgi:hypothetical protein